MPKKAGIIPTSLLLLFCFASLTLFSQLDGNVKIFNTSNGLSQNSITGMAFDNNAGYLWLGTQDGLYRYDGTTFKKFLLDLSSDISNTSNNVLGIYRHSSLSNEIVIRVRNGLLYKIENGVPVLFRDFPKKTVYYYEMQGCYPNPSLFDKFNLSIEDLTLTHKWNPRIRYLLPVNHNDFIVLSNNDNILFYYKNGIKSRKIHVKEGFKAFLKSGENCFLVDKKLNLFIYDQQTGEFKAVKSYWSNSPNDVTAHSDAIFFWDSFNNSSFCYFNSTFRLLQYDTTSRSVTFVPQLTIKDATAHFWTRIIYDSVSANYFLSTLSEGLFQVKPQSIKTVNLNKYMLPNRDALGVINYAILKTSDTTALSTTGFQLSNKTGGITVKKTGNIYSNRETIGMLKNKSILTTENAKLFFYQPSDGYKKQWVFNDSFNKINDSRIVLVQPEDDSVWVSTNRNIFCLTRNNIKTVFTRQRDEGTIYFGLCLFYRNSNDDAFISNNFGFYRLKTSPPYTIDSFPEMKNKQVRHISRYKDILLLSAYKHGLYLFKDNKFEKVMLPYNETEISLCHNTYIDPNGYVWITTDKGLYKSTITSLLESINNPEKKPFFYYYGKAEGISNQEFNGSGTPKYAEFNDGQLLYPSMGGIVVFNPKDLNDKLSRSPIPIERIIIDNKEINSWSGDSIRLSSDFKYLIIDLSVPHFNEPQNLSIEYKLDNNDWEKLNTTSTQRIVILDVPSGKHRLTIRKRTGFSGDDYVYKVVSIHKEKYIYEKPWFYLLIIISLGLLILLITKLHSGNINRKRKALQKLVDEQVSELSKTVEAKELLINIISHDMTTPLRHISFIADILEKGLEKDPEKINNALSDIKSTSERILSGSLSIINWMKYSNQRVKIDKKMANLWSLVNETVEIYTPIANSKNIEIKNEVLKSLFVEVDHNILGTILNNLVSNAVKYSKQGSVRIFVEEVDGDPIFMLKIKDTGVGIKEENLRVINETIQGNIKILQTTSKLSTGLGYVMIAELIKIHGMTISVESEVNVGTTVSIGIPH